MRKKYQTASANYKILEEFALANRNNPTEAERILWEYLKGGFMGEHFRRQHVLLDYIPDFVCLSKKIIIEIDGGYHFEGEQPERDAERAEELKKQGFTVVRFTNEEIINNVDKVLETIGKLLKTNIGENEYIGRYGGEEFLFFFKNISNEESIRKIEKIRNDIKNININYNGEIIENITMSFGVCQLTSLTDVNKNDLIKLRGELISFADHALYKSKNDGRNTTHIFNKENGMIKRVV